MTGTIDMTEVVSLFASLKGLRVILVNGPCLCGKSLRCKIVAEIMRGIGLSFIDTSDVIRDEISKDTPLGTVFSANLENCRKGGLQPCKETMLAVGHRLRKVVARGGQLAVVAGIPRTLTQAQAIIDSDMDCDLVRFMADEDTLKANLQRRKGQGRLDDEFIETRNLVYRFITGKGLDLLRDHRPSRYYELDASPRALRRAVEGLVGLCLNWNPETYGKLIQVMNNTPVGQRIARLSKA